MENEKIIEGNLLIAEYMNHVALVDMDEFYQYHFYWDWLMPVIIKIADEKSWSINATLEFLSDVFEYDGLYNIMDIFEAVVKYIKAND